MRATQSIQIPKGVNAYSTGIMLVWSAYADGVAQDYNFHSFIVPKTCYLKSRTKPKLLDRMLIIEYGIERHVDLLLRGIRI